MRSRSILHIFLLLAAFAVLLLSCGPKEEKEKDVVLFSVNMESSDSFLDVSALEGEAVIYVYCSGTWTYTFRESGRSHWFTVGDAVQVQDMFWAVPISISENEGTTPREGEIVFVSEERLITVTVRQGVMDPVLRNHVPGFYGVEGGDVAFDAARHQTGVFVNGDERSFRIQEASVPSVAVLAGIPRLPRVGQSFPLRYKRVEGGRLIVLEQYDPVTVIHIGPEMIWLKNDEDTYFVIER